MKTTKESNRITLPKGYYVVSDPVEAIKKKQFNEPIRKVLYDLLKPENVGKIFNYRGFKLVVIKLPFDGDFAYIGNDNYTSSKSGLVAVMPIALCNNDRFEYYITQTGHTRLNSADDFECYTEGNDLHIGDLKIVESS